MPSTVYKGDLTEISFGHETGLQLSHHFSGAFTFTHKFRSSKNGLSTIRLAGGGNDLPVDGGVLHVPRGMLVGAKLSIIGGGNFSADDSTDTGQVFTVVEHHPANTATVSTVGSAYSDGAATTTGGNGTGMTLTLTTAGGAISGVVVSDAGVGYSDGDILDVVQSGGSSGQVKLAATSTDFVVTPALSSAVGTTTSTTNDELHFHTFTLPSVDVTMGYNITAASSAEASLTDQFLGLAATVTLPETKVDLKRYHVVGLGRDVAVQVPGRFINEGGSFEVNMHNPRWLYYGLGMEAVDVGTTYDSLLDTDNDFKLNGATKVGATTIVYDGTNSPPNFGTSGTDPVVAGDYVIIKNTINGGSPDATAVADVITYNEADSGNKFGAVANPETTYFDTTETSEIRRIVAITSDRIFLDDALCFQHSDNTDIKFARFSTDNAKGSPHRESTGNLQNPVTRLLYSRSTVPSFAMEVSIRRRDSDGSVDDVTDGGVTDTKQLTRVFRGCKVKDFSMTADTDAALRMTVNFDSALCYTDTGRLETSKGDRYNPHRMFEDTANTDAARKEAGIAKGTQKPYMFYNGTIDLAGVRIGQVVSFNLTGNTGVQQFYTVNGSPTSDKATDQVPHAGARNASIAVEGKTEYMMDMEIIVDDPVFYHHMRRAVDFTATSDNMIRLSFTKQGSGATRERIDILLDDYVITEAPLPIPEDKGPIRAPLKVMPKAMRVISTDTLFHC